MLLPTLKFHYLVFGQTLGTGAFSTVRYARQIVRSITRLNWPEYAVKILSAEKIKAISYTQSASREIAVLHTLSHPSIGHRNGGKTRATAPLNRYPYCTPAATEIVLAFTSFRLQDMHTIPDTALGVIEGTGKRCCFPRHQSSTVYRTPVRSFRTWNFPVRRPSCCLVQEGGSHPMT